MPKAGSSSNAKHKGETLASLRTAFELLKAVQNNGRHTLDELAEQVGLSTKQVGRYLDVLERFGVYFESDEQGRRQQPLQLSTARRGGQPPFNVLFLTQEEQVLLYANMAGLHHAGDQETRQHLWQKVHQSLGVVPINDARVQSVLGSFDKAYKSYEGMRPLLATLLGALYRSQVCQVTYAKPAGEAPNTYEIEPYELVEFDGGLYLYCRVPHYDNVIILAVERIQTLEPQPDHYFKRATAVLEEIARKKARAFRIFDDECVYDVRLRFLPAAAFYAAERIWHPSQTIDRHADGSLTLSFQASGKIEIERWIRSWGEEVAVLHMAPLAGAGA